MKDLLVMGIFDRSFGMRGWGVFLVGFLVCSLDLGGAQLPEKLYFDANQLAKDALILEYRKSHPEATAKYLQARKLYLEILEKFPTWQAESGLVRKKLNEQDARLRPLLLTQGISPGSVIHPPGHLQAMVARCWRSRGPASPSSTPGRLRGVRGAGCGVVANPTAGRWFLSVT